MDDLREVCKLILALRALRKATWDDLGDQSTDHDQWMDQYNEGRFDQVRPTLWPGSPAGGRGARERPIIDLDAAHAREMHAARSAARKEMARDRANAVDNESARIGVPKLRPGPGETGPPRPLLLEPRKDQESGLPWGDGRERFHRWRKLREIIEARDKRFKLIEPEDKPTYQYPHEGWPDKVVTVGRYGSKVANGRYPIWARKIYRKVINRDGNAHYLLESSVKGPSSSSGSPSRRFLNEVKDWAARNNVSYTTSVTHGGVPWEIASGRGLSPHRPEGPSSPDNRFDNLDMRSKAETDADYAEAQQPQYAWRNKSRQNPIPAEQPNKDIGAPKAPKSTDLLDP